MTAPEEHPDRPPERREGRHLLIVEARFYEDIADMLLAGATRALQIADATFERVIVPGALEIPAALRLGLASGRYDAFVALGCVIRGETSHYDIVAGESARAVMDLAVRQGALVGNGILTCDTGEQARRRADPGAKDKGGDAVRAALALLEVRSCLTP
jgi:6,7-dimethyl-8-ribityllumazine synthase